MLGGPSSIALSGLTDQENMHNRRKVRICAVFTGISCGQMSKSERLLLHKCSKLRVP